MSKPKILSVFDNSTEGSAYGKLNNPIIHVTHMNDTILVPDNVNILCNTLLTFRAPCNCTEVSSLTIKGATYPIVSVEGKPINTGYSFISGAIISVLVDIENRKAYLHSGSAGISFQIITWEDDD